MAGEGKLKSNALAIVIWTTVFRRFQKCDLSFAKLCMARIGGDDSNRYDFILFIDFIHRIFGKNKIHLGFFVNLLIVYLRYKILRK